MHECHLSFENLLEHGDGIRLNYVSARGRTKKEAQKAAFAEVLSYLLFRGPLHLRTHASQWHVDRLNAVRIDAEFDLRKRLGPRPRDQWTPLSSPNVAEETRTTSRGQGPIVPPIVISLSNRRAELAYLLL